MTYLLRISQEHAYAVQRALELYQRISMGQTKEIGFEFEGKHGDWKLQRGQGLDAVCEQLKRILFPDLGPNAYYGITSEQAGKSAHLCYEVFAALRHRIAWTETPLTPGTLSLVSHDEPLLFPSGVFPRPECASEDGKQPELAATGQRLAREIEEILETRDIKEAAEKLREWKRIIETTAGIPVISITGAVNETETVKNGRR